MAEAGIALVGIDFEFQDRVSGRLNMGIWAKKAGWSLLPPGYTATAVKGSLWHLLLLGCEGFYIHQKLETPGRQRASCVDVCVHLW